MALNNADSKLTQTIINKLTMRGIRTPWKVNVGVAQGQVTLTGTVTQAHQKTAAASVCSAISGVKRVINNLIVKAAERRT
jgi:osmotically-inducible protein OsmY